MMAPGGWKVPALVTVIGGVAVLVGLALMITRDEKDTADSRGFCKQSGLLMRHIAGVYFCVDERGRVYDRETIFKNGYVRGAK